MSKSIILWLTGLSGAGKTTISELILTKLESKGFRGRIIDGDDVRDSYNKVLSFSFEDIRLNNHNIAELCVKHSSEYDVILVPVISPYRKIRDEVRAICGMKFHEVYISAKVETVEFRDVKGLYQKAQVGLIKNMIGYSKNEGQYVVPYEAPLSPDLELNSDHGLEVLKENISKLLKFTLEKVNEYKVQS